MTRLDKAAAVPVVCTSSEWQLGLNCQLGRPYAQWRRQDLLQGGTKLEIRSRGTHGDFRAGCSSCSVTNSFVTITVLIERVVDICTITDYTILR